MGGFIDKFLELDEHCASTQNWEVNINTQRCQVRKAMIIPRFSFGICNFGENIFAVSGLQ